MEQAQRTAAPHYRKDHLEHLSGLYPLADEFDYWIRPDAIQGAIPAGIRGTFYRIGPGRNQLGDQAFGHWFDGDGMVHGFTFTENGVWYRNRYVRTPKYVKETASGRIQYRGFGTNIPGGFLKNIGRPPANAANTNLIYHGGRLMALWEGGRPWQIDPVTLTTQGEFNYHGKLGPADAFSAHGKVSPKDGYYYNHGIGFGRKGPQINVYRINPQGELVKKVGIPVKFAAFLHDFSFAGDYLVYLVHPLGIKNPLPFLLGTKTFNDCVRYNPAWGMEAVIVHAESLEVVRRIPLDPCVVVHTGNAWQEGDELVLELMRFENFDVNELLSNILSEDIDYGDKAMGAETWRYRLSLATDEYRAEPIEGLLPAEFPQWDLRFSGSPTRYLYTAATADRGYGGSTFFNAVQRLDRETGEVTVHQFPAGQFTSEAVFMPVGEAEGDGYLGTVVYDATRHLSDFVILDAGSEALDEVARIPLQNHIPFGFHCGYTRKAFLPNAE